MKPHVITIKTKADNVDLPGRIVRDTADLDHHKDTRYIVYPLYEKQIPQIARLFERVWREGGWTIYIDELFYVHQLHRVLRHHIDRLLTQGRSKGITVVMSMQRPVAITRFALSQSTHLISFRLDGRDAKTLAEATNPAIKDVVSHLNRYQFVWYYRPERRMFRGKLQDLEA